MDIPANLYYSKEHEWVRFENGKAFVGITDFAQHHLGDIVFVELPEIGTELNAMDEAGVVESVKAVSPVYSPVSGKIIDVNTELESAPERLNSAPYDNVIFTVAIENDTDKNQLMDAVAYTAFCENEN